MALITLALFVAFTIAGIMRLDRLLTYVNEASNTMAEVKDLFSQYVSYNGILVAITILSAILCGVSRYAYLHSAVKLDLYHSMPIKRSKMFAVQYLSGVLQFVIPFLLNIVLILLVGSIRSVTTGAIVGQAFIWLLIHLLFFLVIYTMTILAMVMTGKIVVGILGVGVFFSYFSVILFLNEGLFSMFFQTYYNNRANFLNSLLEFASPFTIYLNVVSRAMSGNMFIWQLFIALILTAVLLVVTLILYLRRPSEAAGQAIAFAKTEAVIKFLLVVPIAVGVGMIAHSMTWVNKDLWLVLGVIFGAVIASAVIEFTYNVDFSRVLARKKLFLGSLLTALIIIGFFRFDIAGYDRYVPEKENISSAAVLINGLGSDSYEEMDKDGNQISNDQASYVLENMNLTEYDQIFRIIDGAFPVDKSTSQVVIKFRLTNGSEKTRIYAVDSDVLKAEMDELYQNEQFKEGLYPIINMVGDSIGKISLRRMDDNLQLDLSRKQIISIVDTYRQELMSLPYEVLKENSLTDLYFEGTGRKLINGSYPLNSHFKETIKLLEEYGYTVETKLDPKKIISIVMNDYSGNETITKEFKDRKEIEELSQHLMLTRRNDYFLYQYNGKYEVLVTYMDDKGDTQTAYLAIDEGNLPDFVTKAIEKQSQ